MGLTSDRTARRGRLGLLETLESRVLLAGSVVINELHVNPDQSNELVEFIELHNPGDAPVALGGASFTSGITFTFPAGATLQSGGYLLVAENPAALQTKYGVAGAVGPWTGKLSNEGENIVLRDSAGVVLDEVDYGVGFPWPTIGDEPGYSMELINPAFDNNLGGNWRSANPLVDATLIPSGSPWRYRKGTSEASSPTSAWRNLSFVEDATWLTGVGTIGYDPTLGMGTNLADMRNGYVSIFLRKTFSVTNPASITALRLEARFDDGFNVWINGQLAKQVNTSSANLAYNTALGVSREDVNYQTITLSPTLLQAGTNIIAVQHHNSAIDSNDCFFDARLIGSSGAVGPTPGNSNAVSAANAPPQMRQLNQSIQQPVAGQDVIISIKASDPDGVQNVMFQYQLVNPGSYIRLSDPAYQTNWTANLPMHDDGLNGDAVGGDSVYSIIMPGSLQTHRRVVRYRITATDGLGASIRAPYLDDPSPNFAYFVYNGVPSWTGANQPGVTSPQTFGTNITNAGPAVYHLVANATDVINCQYVSGYNDQLFKGTFVYDGVVYDHIEFRNRGEYSTYESGKNKWRINFGRGHELAARDNYGRPYQEKLRKLNLNANASPWMPVNRGAAGLDESVAYRLYQLAGVPSSNTHYVHFRVIDDAIETSPTDQYSGDLWGLYLAVEHTDSRFIDEHELPDGNIYEIEYGPGSLRNQAPNQPANGSDWNTFRASAMTTATPLAWWQSNVNLPVFYSFTAINRVVSNVDLLDDSNYSMYHAPDNLWQPMPWDLDMIYAAETHRSGKTYISNSLVHPQIQLELRNRGREIMDLLFSDAGRMGGQIGQLVEEQARLLNPSNGNGTFGTGWAELDQYLWNYHPRTTNPHRGAFYRTPATDPRWGGTWTRTLSPANFNGMAQWIINFMTDTDPDAWAIGDGDQRGYGFNYLEYEAADAAIPNRPTVSYTGAAGFPINQLQFSSSAYSDPNGSPFAAMQWRIGEVSNPSAPGFDPNQPWTYEIDPVWESGVLSAFNSNVAIPAGALEVGHTYRLRVRMMDNTGRWSRWSDVSTGAGTQFVTTAVATPLPASLRVTELSYNPSAFGSTYDAQDFEFIELKNISAQVLDLDDATFSGIDFTFGNVSLAPGQVGVVVRNTEAFQSRYGTNALILGSYGATGTNFSNGGEQIVISDSFGNTIADFTYDDAWHPQTDGGGYTLEVINPASSPDLSSAASWRASTDVGGSPGIDSTIPSAPTVIDATFDYETGHRYVIQFSHDVSASLNAGDLQIAPAGGGANLYPGSVTWNAATETATFSMTTLLANGDYVATLPVGSVANGSTPLASNFSFNFFTLAGDANRDRVVDISDLMILAANWQAGGRVFSQGNFNFDAQVNQFDLGVLSSNWQQTPQGTGASNAPIPSLAGIIPTPPRAGQPIRPVFRPPIRIAGDVLAQSTRPIV